MKKRSLRYAGDKAVRALLERYACPTSFHVVRTRLLGNIATPKLDASPLRAIESCAFYLFIRQPMGRKSALRREIPWILRGFQGRLSC